jgi:hypothetical protein
MNPGPKTFHHDARAQLEILDAHQRLRMNHRTGRELEGS